MLRDDIKIILNLFFQTCSTSSHLSQRLSFSTFMAWTFFLIASILTQVCCTNFGKNRIIGCNEKCCTLRYLLTTSSIVWCIKLNEWAFQPQFDAIGCLEKIYGISIILRKLQWYKCLKLNFQAPWKWPMGPGLKSNHQYIKDIWGPCVKLFFQTKHKTDKRQNI